MRRHRADLILVVLTLVLMALGLLTVFAVGPRVAQFENSQSGSNFSDSYFFLHHGASVLLSITAMIVASKIPYRMMDKLSLKIIGVGFFLCFLVFVWGKLGNPGGLVTCDEGACRAFRVPGLGMGFQPVEIVKVGVLFYISWLIKERKKQNLLKTRELWIPVGTIVVLTGLLVAFGLKDFGSTVVVFAMICSMLFIGGVDLKQFAIGLGVLGALAILMIVLSPHRIARILNFGDGNYHQENSLISLGTGGLFGVGMGNSIQATGYLPEALSDSIIAIIGEVTGFVGAAGVVIVFAFILVRMLSIAKRTSDSAQSLYVVGLAAWIFAHVIINLGGMLGLTPVKGITLPFLSHGGTSMLFVSFAFGVALQISAWTSREVINEDSSSRRGQRRARNAGYRRSERD